MELGGIADCKVSLSLFSFDYVCVLSCFGHASTLGNPADCSLPGSPVHGILQARFLERVAMPSSRGSSRPMDQIHFSYVACIGRQVLYYWYHLGRPQIPRDDSN